MSRAFLTIRTCKRFVQGQYIPDIEAKLVGRNAGCFIWVDLRHYLHNSRTPIALSTPRLTPSEVDTYRAYEAKLFKGCIEGGIGISPGTGFSTEELGWFRISFAVEKEALYTGLGRLKDCLQAIDAHGWD